MRRKGGVGLVRNEERVLAAVLTLRHHGQREFHGYQLVKAFEGDPRLNVAMSTLYRCLSRLEERKLLKGTWRAPADDKDGRPIRFYHLTAKGVDAAEQVEVEITFDGTTARLVSE